MHAVVVGDRWYEVGGDLAQQGGNGVVAPGADADGVDGVAVGGGRRVVHTQLDLHRGRSVEDVARGARGSSGEEDL
jgi:hypothetical protein